VARCQPLNLPRFPDPPAAAGATAVASVATAVAAVATAVAAAVAAATVTLTAVTVTLTAVTVAAAAEGSVWCAAAPRAGANGALGDGGSERVAQRRRRPRAGRWRLGRAQ
jgi:hypothetical protein